MCVGLIEHSREGDVCGRTACVCRQHYTVMLPSGLDVHTAMVVLDREVWRHCPDTTCLPSMHVCVVACVPAHVYEVLCFRAMVPRGLQALGAVCDECEARVRARGS